ncbi:MAG: YIP1 family protein [Anaerolineae bacterium]
MTDYWHLFVSALFLRREAYEYQRDRKDSFAHGLFLIVLIAILTALAGIGGAAFRYAASPSADAIKNTVLTHLQAMPFYTQMIQPYSQAEQQWLSGYNRSWEYLGSLFMGFPTNAQGWTVLFTSVITTPILWVIVWLFYGALAHLVARRGAEHVELSHALGTLALASAPQAFSFIGLFPQASASMFALWLWSMILNVFAVKTAYRITTRHAIWAALFPLLLLFLLLIVILIIGFILLAGAVRGGQP